MCVRLLAALIFLLGCYYGSLFWAYDTEPPPWKAEAPSTEARFESVSALVGKRFFLLFGFNRYDAEKHALYGSDHVTVLDTDTMQWSQQENSPFRGTHVARAVDGVKIYFAGGFEGDHPGPATDLFMIYDTEADSWSYGPTLPARVGGGVMARLGRHLHYASGYFSPMPEPANDKHWRIDLDNPETGWLERAPLPVARGHAGAAVLDGQLYVVGGSLIHDPGDQDTDLVHRYDPALDAWTEVAKFPYPVSHTEPGTFAHEGKLVVVGGRNGGSETLSERELQDIYSYDPHTDRWQQVGRLPLRLRAPAAAIVDGKVIISTGSTYWGKEPVARTWSISCDNNPVCGNGDYPALKSSLRVMHKNIAVLLPLRVQSWLKLREVALSEVRD